MPVVPATGVRVGVLVVGAALGSESACQWAAEYQWGPAHWLTPPR